MLGFLQKPENAVGGKEEPKDFKIRDGRILRLESNGEPSAFKVPTSSGRTFTREVQIRQLRQIGFTVLLLKFRLSLHRSHRTLPRTNALLRVQSRGWLGLALIQIAIAIGIGIDSSPVVFVTRRFLPYLISSSAQPTQHRRHAVQFSLPFLAFGFVKSLADYQNVLYGGALQC